MIIWFALLIPVVALAVIYLIWPRTLQWWEIFIPFVVSILLIGLMKLGVQSCQTRDTEYWTGWIWRAEFQEKWTEEWDEYIPEQGHTDDKGRYHVDVPAHWEHRIRHHPNEWWMHGSNGEWWSIDRDSYFRMCNMWHMNHCDGIPAGHHNQTSHGDGKRWHTDWNQQRETMITCTTTHSYENRVQASKSIFKFREFTKKEVKEYGLYDYPPVEDVTRVPSILGDAGPDTASANRMLQIRNAELGKKKQVRMWVLIFRTPDQQIAFDQESYWCGGNKNEFVLCLGLDDQNKVKWSYAFSWTEVEELKIEARQLALENTNLTKIVANMADKVEEKFVRKPFSDFNYLTIEPPFWAVVTTFIFTLLVNVGCSFFIVLNEFDNPEINTDGWRGQDFLGWASNLRSRYIRKPWDRGPFVRPSVSFNDQMVAVKRMKRQRERERIRGDE